MAWFCLKRGYASAKEARTANRKASYRLRTYFCEACRAWHVTNSEKRHSSKGEYYDSYVVLPERAERRKGP